MVNKALGRGLAALISDKPKQKPILKQDINIEYIDTSLIKSNAYQPREKFAQDKLNDLTASIKSKGILQPLIVRRNKDRYELIAGERRLRAAKALKMDRVPAIIRDADNKDSLVLSIVENIQREKLNSIEEAHAFKRLTDEFGLTQEIIAVSLGKDRATVSNTLRLLNLPKEVQDEVANNTISMGHARALLGLASSKDQLKFFEKVVADSLSVRELERMIQESPQRKKQGRTLSSRLIKKDQYVVAAEDELRNKIGSKVRINIGKKNKGTLTIEFYNLEDLERLVEFLKK